MTELIEPHFPSPKTPTGSPSLVGSIATVLPGRIEAAGHMILEDVRRWMGSVEETQIVGRWVPDGHDLGDLAATMAVAFSVGSESIGYERPNESHEENYDNELIADAFFWLDCVQPGLSMEDLCAMFPWAVSTNYRSPIAGFGEVQTLRCNTGAPWRIGGEIHVTTDGTGRPFCAELTAAFWLKAEIEDGLKWLSEYLSRRAARTDTPVFETITDGDEVRRQHSWWADDTAHYEVFCTLGEECAGDANSDAAPHYITVRKFLVPDEPTMEEVLSSIRKVITEDEAAGPLRFGNRSVLGERRRRDFVPTSA